MNSAELTDDEIAVLNALTEAWNRFCVLPVQHPDDAEEFKFSVHAAQRILMARVARRVHQGMFRIIPGGRS